MIKKILSLVMLLCSTCFASQSLYSNAAQSPQVGVGLLFGQPTGLSGKFWFDKNSAIDTDFTYTFDHAYNIIVDYLYHPTIRSFIVKPYIGIGAEVFFWQCDYWHYGDFYYSNTVTDFGARIPLGLEIIPHNVPMGFFAELAPGLIFTHGVSAFLQGGVGLRFYFM